MNMAQAGVQGPCVVVIVGGGGNQHLFVDIMGYVTVGSTAPPQ